MDSFAPNLLPPPDNKHDLEELYLRYRRCVRARRKAGSALLSNQVVSDQLLGYLKMLRKKHRNEPISQETYEVIVAVVTIQCYGTV